MGLVLGDLAAVIRTDDRPLEQGLDDARTRLQRFGDKAQQILEVAGAAAGAALAAGIVATLNIDAGHDKLAAQLGLTAEESGRIGKVAGDLFADNYGESMADVEAAVGAVISSIDGMRTASDEALTAAAAKASNLTTVFEVDVARAAQVAGQAVKSGLVKDVDEAFDLITISMQKLPANVREDLLDAIDEYGPFLQSIGIKGEEAFSLLVAASEKGAFGLDKTGDALKEFTILSTDMSTAAGEGYKAIGLNQEQMARRLLKGGADGAKAFDQIVSGLLKIKDPVKQSQAALALFGTPLEDLSVTEIPLFLKSLQGVEGGLGNVEGAADRMGETLADNANAKLEGFRRKAQQAFVEKLAEAIPVIEAVVGFLERHEAIVGPLATALTILAVAITVVAAALKVWAVVQTVLNLALWTSPITWIVLAIVTLIAIIVYIAMKTDWFSQAWNAAWGWIKDVALSVGRWLRDELWGVYIRGTYEGIVAGIMWVVDGFTSHLMALKKTGEKWWDWFAALPGKIKTAFFAVGDFISAPFRFGFNAISRFWNGTVGKLHWSVPGWVPFVGGNSISAPKLPQMAEGAWIPATPGGRAVNVGEAGKGELVAPEDKMNALLDRAVAAGRELAAGTGGHAEQTIVVNVIVDGEVVQTETIKAVRSNPEEVALANRAGGKSLGFGD